MKSLTKEKRYAMIHAFNSTSRYLDDLPYMDNSNRKAMYRNWSNQKANPALKTKAGNK